MKLNFYPETDSLYIDLAERSSTESKEVSEGIVLDYDSDGNLVGIDIDRTRKILDKCDEGLTKKPTLASIYNRTWQRKFRKKFIGSKTLSDLSFPGAYGGPYFFEGLGLYPQDYQDRLEEGANILLQKLNKSDKNGLIKRLRGVGSCSVEEELLLVRGFALEFGIDAIKGPVSNKDKPRPEFFVTIDEQNISIEAKGLYDSKIVRELNKSSINSGRYFWISTDPRVGDPNHVRANLAKKIFKSACHSPCIIVLTLYGAFDFLTRIDLSRQMAIKPSDFRISAGEYPLAVALVCNRLIQGVWFNESVVQRIGISKDTKKRICTAIQNSFYPRNDEIFLHEDMTDDDHNSAVNGMRD